MSAIDNATARQGASTASKKRFTIRMVTVLIGGMFLDGYILGIIGPVSGRMAEDLQLDAVWQGLIAAAALVGILIGSPIGGWAADKFGRKPIFMFDIGLFAIASGMQFFVDSPVLLLVVRLLMGIAIGTEYAVGWPLMAEFSPARLRGRLMGAMEIAWYAGFMLAFLIGHLLSEYTDLSWHFILGTSTFIAVVLFLSRLGLPESPRWLWSVGRQDEARALAAKYMPDDALDDLQHEDVRKGSFGMLFSKAALALHSVHFGVLVLRRDTVFRDCHLRRQRAEPVRPRRWARRWRRTLRRRPGRSRHHRPADRQGRPSHPVPFRRSGCAPSSSRSSDCGPARRLPSCSSCSWFSRSSTRCTPR